MGMYDTLGDGYQVKTFSIPCFYHSAGREKFMDRELGFMGGLCRYFGTKDKLPLKEWWQIYPDNFMIIDYDMYYDGTDNVIHVILNGKYSATYEDIDDIPESCFEQCHNYYGYYGDEVVNVNSKEKMKEYFGNLKLYYAEFDIIRSKYNKYFKSYIEALKKCKDEIYKNSEEFKSIEKEYKENNKKEQEEITAIKEKYIVQYLTKNEPYSATELFGGYLDCLKKYLERKNMNVQDYEKLNALIREFNELREKTNVTLEDFYNWYQPDEANRKEIDELMNYVTDYKVKDDSEFEL